MHQKVKQHSCREGGGGKRRCHKFLAGWAKPKILVSNWPFNIENDTCYRFSSERASYQLDCQVSLSRFILRIDNCSFMILMQLPPRYPKQQTPPRSSILQINWRSWSTPPCKSTTKVRKLISHNLLVIIQDTGDAITALDNFGSEGFERPLLMM